MCACLVCGSSGDKPFYRSLRRCDACGFVFAESADTADELIWLYQDAYFRGGEYDNYPRDKSLLQANFARRLAALRQYAPGGRLFEIGAAYGFFLELAQAHWRVSGIDVAAAAARHARDTLRLDVTCGEFLDYPLDAAGYDVFCMWDTIEHLACPDRYLARIAAHLRPGGVLALTTGDIASLMARVQGEHWRLIHPPTHLWYFSAATLTQLLARYGLEIVHLSHPGNYRSFAALGRWALPPSSAGDALYRRLATSRFADRGVSLNPHDIMFVIARYRASGCNTA
jgi:2-polyprenyl-3-methyl-5-hydroxy-6-metoxy-1,4-benzoquinol methylase